MKHHLTLRLFSAIISLTSSATCFHAGAESSQNAIKGFRFQTCDEKQCVEASASKAWLSQINGGFSSDGPTHMIVRSPKDGSVLQEFKGTEASYSPKVQVITLDREDGSTVFISLKDGAIKILGSSKDGGQK